MFKDKEILETLKFINLSQTKLVELMNVLMTRIGTIQDELSEIKYQLNNNKTVIGQSLDNNTNNIINESKYKSAI